MQSTQLSAAITHGKATLSNSKELLATLLFLHGTSAWLNMFA
jgi:hypothetical protein